jgi:hypothetical protein
VRRFEFTRSIRAFLPADSGRATEEQSREAVDRHGDADRRIAMVKTLTAEKKKAA